MPASYPLCADPMPPWGSLPHEMGYRVFVTPVCPIESAARPFCTPQIAAGARHREGNLETRGKSSPTTKAGPSRSPRAVRHLHESFPTSDPPLRAPHAPAFAFEAERADTRWRTLGPGLLQEVRGACTPCTLLTDALTTPQLHRSRDALPFQILRRNLRGEELVG